MSLTVASRDRFAQSAARLGDQLGTDATLYAPGARVQRVDGTSQDTFAADGAHLTGVSVLTVKATDGASLQGDVPRSTVVTIGANAYTVAVSASWNGSSVDLTLASALLADVADDDVVTLAGQSWPVRVIDTDKVSGNFATDVRERASFQAIVPWEDGLPRPGKGWRIELEDGRAGYVLAGGRKRGAWILPCGVGGEVVF